MVLVSKKAVSPIIAISILTVVAIISATILYTWQKSYQGKVEKKIGYFSSSKIERYLASMSLRDVEVYGIDKDGDMITDVYKVSAHIHNTGDITLHDVKVYIDDKIVGEVEELAPASSVKISKEMRSKPNRLFVLAKETAIHENLKTIKFIYEPGRLLKLATSFVCNPCTFYQYLPQGKTTRFDIEIVNFDTKPINVTLYLNGNLILANRSLDYAEYLAVTLDDVKQYLVTGANNEVSIYTLNAAGSPVYSKIKVYVYPVVEYE